MASKTVQQQIDEKKALLRAQTSDVEFRSLLRTAAVQSEQDRTAAKMATSADRAAVAWLDKVNAAKGLLAMSAEDRAVLLQAASLEAEAKGHGEAKGQIQAAKEAGILPESADGSVTVVKGKAEHKGLPQSSVTGEAS